MLKFIKRLINSGNQDSAASTIAKEVLEKQSTVSHEQAVRLNTVRYGDPKEAKKAANDLLKPVDSKRSRLDETKSKQKK